jgi:hypothetical protein
MYEFAVSFGVARQWLPSGALLTASPPDRAIGHMIASRFEMD